MMKWKQTSATTEKQKKLEKKKQIRNHHSEFWMKENKTNKQTVTTVKKKTSLSSFALSLSLSLALSIESRRKRERERETKTQRVDPGTQVQQQQQQKQKRRIYQVAGLLSFTNIVLSFFISFELDSLPFRYVDIVVVSVVVVVDDKTKKIYILNFYHRRRRRRKIHLFFGRVRNMLVCVNGMWQTNLTIKKPNIANIVARNLLLLLERWSESRILNEERYIDFIWGFLFLACFDGNPNFFLNFIFGLEKTFVFLSLTKRW